MHSSDTTKKQPKKIAAPGQESRRFVRVECVLRAEFRLHNHDAWLPAEVLDLSVAGMKLRFNPFQRGRTLLPEVFEWAEPFPLSPETRVFSSRRAFSEDLPAERRPLHGRSGVRRTFAGGPVQARRALCGVPETERRDLIPLLPLALREGRLLYGNKKSSVFYILLEEMM